MAPEELQQLEKIDAWMEANPDKKGTPDWQVMRRTAEAIMGEVKPKTSKAMSMLLGLANGIFQNWAAEAVGAGAGVASALTGGDFSEGYDDAYKTTNDAIQQSAKDNPYVHGAAEVGGSLTSLAIPAGAAARTASLGGKVLRGMGGGAAGGAFWGAGEDGSGLDRTKTALEGAAWGMGGGAAGGAVGHAGSRMIERAKPTIDSVGRQASNAYDRARAAGVAMRPEAFSRLVDDLHQLAAREGATPELQPIIRDTIVALQAQRGTYPGFSELETMRRNFNTAIKNISNPETQRVGYILRRRYDDFIDNLTPRDLVGGTTGDAAAAHRELKNARRYYKAQKTAETLEAMLDDAADRAAKKSTQTGEAQNINDAIYAFKHKGRKKLTPEYASLSREEKRMVDMIIAGQPMDRVLKYVGKLAPTNVITQMGLVNASGVMGAGGYHAGGAGGAAGAAAVPLALGAVGAGARKVSGDRTNAMAMNLVDQVLTNTPDGGGNILSRSNALSGIAPKVGIAVSKQARPEYDIELPLK